MFFRTRFVPLMFVLFGGNFVETTWALPVPTEDVMRMLGQNEPLTIRVDFRNVVGPNQAGFAPLERLQAILDSINSVWAQCSIQFTARTIENVSAQERGIPYRPLNVEDLGRIHTALRPAFAEENGIPITIAGRWGFYSEQFKVYLAGLGFVRNNGGKVEEIGAMMDNDRTFNENAGPTLAHELAHALSLPEIQEPYDNLMGPGGSNKLMPIQCMTAREFAKSALGPFRIRPETIAAAQIVRDRSVRN